MGERGRRVHGHPKNLTLQEGRCLWLLRSVLHHKIQPVGFVAPRVMGDVAMTSYDMA